MSATGNRIEAATSALAESALDFLDRAVREIKDHPKYAVINFATAVELFMKARLMHEHWALVVEKTSEAKIGRFLRGECKTVGPREALNRLNRICGQNIPEDAIDQFMRLAAHRNRMVHFFHEAGGKEASDVKIEEVVKEQCLCWFHLEKLLRKWSDQFEELSNKVAHIGWQMKRNRDFLQVTFDQIKPKLDEARAAGTVFQPCSGCGFDAAAVNDISEHLHDRECKVCGLVEGFVTMPCPAECDATLTIEADHGSDRTCEKCGHEVDEGELAELLETDAQSFEDYTQRNCALCSSMGTVIQHNEVYVCTACLNFSDEIALCEWCNEMQMGGGDLEFSHHTGCEFCDGHAGWMKDD